MTNFTTLTPSRLSSRRLTARLRERLARWSERRATRRALGKLDSHMLRDIGLYRVGDDYLAVRPQERLR